jgi:hypothetical protein
MVIDKAQCTLLLNENIYNKLFLITFIDKWEKQLKNNRENKMCTKYVNLIGMQYGKFLP